MAGLYTLLVQTALGDVLATQQQCTRASLPSASSTREFSPGRDPDLGPVELRGCCASS
jgi:hypothetical protein